MAKYYKVSMHKHILVVGGTKLLLNSKAQPSYS